MAKGQTSPLLIFVLRRKIAPSHCTADLSIQSIMQRRMDMGIGNEEDSDDGDDDDEDDWEEDDED